MSKSWAWKHESLKSVFSAHLLFILAMGYSLLEMTVRYSGFVDQSAINHNTSVSYFEMCLS